MLDACYWPWHDVCKMIPDIWYINDIRYMTYDVLHMIYDIWHKIYIISKMCQVTMLDVTAFQLALLYVSHYYMHRHAPPATTSQWSGYRWILWQIYGVGTGCSGGVLGGVFWKAVTYPKHCLMWPPSSFHSFWIYLGHFRGAPWTVSGMASGHPWRGPRNPPACLSLQSEFITIPRQHFFSNFPVNIKLLMMCPALPFVEKKIREDKRR